MSLSFTLADEEAKPEFGGDEPEVKDQDSSLINTNTNRAIVIPQDSWSTPNMRIDIDKFDGNGDFRIWRRKIRALLAQQRLLKALDDPIIWPEEISEEQKNEVLETATGTIIFHLTDSIIRLVDGEDTLAKIWRKLDTLFQVKSLTNKIYLKERLFGYRMSTSKSLEENLDEFLKMTIELANSGDKEALSDENQAIIILNSLPEAYKEVKTAIKYGRTEITCEEVVSALRSKDFELKTERNNSSGESNYGRGKSPSKSSNKNQSTKNKAKSQDGSNKGNDKEKELRTCFYCKKTGHLKKDCFKWKKNQKDKATTSTTENKDAANYGDCHDGGEVLLVNSNSQRSEWILDSGCTYHMTFHKEWLTDFKDITGGSVVLGNSDTCQVEGIGNISIKMFDGCTRILQNVRLVPSLTRNLVSLGVLDDSGYVNKIEKGIMRISRGSTVVIKGQNIDSLYHLIGETQEASSVNVTEAKEDQQAVLWHRRLGHISDKGLQLMKD